MRFFFCLMPAVIVAGLLSLISPIVGFLVGWVVFLFGWDITEAVPERGEYNKRK